MDTRENWIEMMVWFKGNSKWVVYFSLFLIFFFHCAQKYRGPWDNGALRMSDNGHYIQHENGTPFLWIGDTGWAMFQRLAREQVDLYLDARQAQGFQLVQSVAFWFPHGGIDSLGPHNAPNAYGHRPFKGGVNSPETSQALVIKGGSAENPNDYWDFADYIVQAVKSRGMYLGLLPCWGNAYINNRMPGSQIEFTAEEAFAYGEFLGRRYGKEPHIVWILGGDVDPVNFGDRDQRAVYRAMAEGIVKGESGKTVSWNENSPAWDTCFMTFHAVQAPQWNGGRGGSSSIWFHTDPWLDVNMIETFAWTDRIYPLITQDYEKTGPVKPTVLGEGAYEDGRYSHDCGFITPLKVRRQAWHAFFAGAAGHTYGHYAVWPFRGEFCGQTWTECLDTPAAGQIARILKEFLHQHEWHKFAPNQDILISDRGEGETLLCAMSDRQNNTVMVYFPEVRSAEIDLKGRDVAQLSCTWFNPADGAYRTFQASSRSFSPPADWQDAVLIVR